MSQVKKLQSGGSLTIDGKKYDVTPEFIQALSSHLSKYGESAAPLAGLTAALQRGEDVVYDSIGNTISGMSGQWAGVNDRQNTRRNTGASQWRKNWEATFNTDAHKFRNAVKLLSGFTYNPSSETKSSNLTNISGDRTFFKYNTNDDGTKTYLKDASENISIPKRINDFVAYINANDEDKKGYKLDENWYTPERIAGLTELYNKYNVNDASGNNMWTTRLQGIFDRAKSGTLDAADRAFLENFNIGEDLLDSNSTTPTLSAADKEKWTNAGFGSLIDLLGSKAHLNDDGSLSLNEGNDWGWNLGDLAGSNIWFNDDFYNSRYGADGSFDPYKDLTFYNGRLYGLNNPILSRILNADGGFNSMKKAGNWVGADNIIRTRFTTSASENPSFLGSDQYSTFLSNNPKYRFSDLTGLVQTQDMNPDDQIIQYVDLNDNSLVGPYRQYQYKYALLDNRGNLKRELTQDDLIDVENGSIRDTGLNTYKYISGNNNPDYNRRYYEDILDKNKEATGFRFYRNVKDPNGDVILHIPFLQGKSFMSRPHEKDKDIKLSPELAKVLSENPIWLERVISDAKNKADFQKILSMISNQNVGITFGFESALKRMGFSDDEIQVFKNAKKGSKSERQQRYLVNSPILKNGGVLKEQSGGRAGGAKNATGVTEKQIAVTNTNPQNAAGINEIGGKNWTDADTLEMGALLADLGSLGAAFVPGANVASAGIGAGASTARFMADQQRGTKNSGWNYLLNLGMDAATLLPILGGVSNTAKVVKAVKNALPTIIKAASVYGISSAAVDSAKKIANGEKWTARDVSMIVNALTAGVGLSRQGGLGRKSMKVTKTEPVKLVGKNGNKSIELNSEELKGIDTPEKLFDKLFTKAKASNANLTKENFGEQYDVDSLSKLTQKWKPGWNPKTWFAKREINTFTPKTKTSKEVVAETGNSFKDWWHGVGRQQQAYNNQLRGNGAVYNRTYNGHKVGQEIVLPKGEGEQLMYLDTNLPAVVRKVQIPTVKTRVGKANWQNFAIPQWINAFTDSNYQRNEDQQPAGFVMQPLYQKKGGVIKGQSGFNTWLTNAKKLTEDIKNLDMNPQIGNNSESIKRSQSEIPGQPINFDLNVPMNWIRAGHSMVQSDKQLQNWSNRPRYHMDAPLLNAPRFIDSGQGNAYDAAANKTRMFKNVYTDPVAADIMQRQRQADATQLELQGNLDRSQEFGKYLVGLDEFNNKRPSMLTNVNNQNRHFDWQHDIEDIQMSNSNIAEKSKFFDQAAYATQDWYNRQHELKTGIQSANSYNGAAQDAYDWYVSQVKALDTRIPDKNSDAYIVELKNLQNTYRNRIQNAKVIALAFPFSQFVKRGGKIGKDSKVTYSRDPYPELLIQNAKSSSKFVEKLNDSVIKLILQTKPTHVS